MLIKWIGETTYSSAFGELKAGKLLEIPDDTAKIWIDQGSAEPIKISNPEQVIKTIHDPGKLKLNKTAKAGGGRK